MYGKRIETESLWIVVCGKCTQTQAGLFFSFFFFFLFCFVVVVVVTSLCVWGISPSLLFSSLLFSSLLLLLLLSPSSSSFLIPFLLFLFSQKIFGFSIFSAAFP